MIAFVYLEAGQSSEGRRIRLAVGWGVSPSLASMIFFLARLF